MNSAALLEQLAMLREAGADRFDPVRFRYIEALANRAHGAREPLGERLTEKSSLSLRDYIVASTRAGGDERDNSPLGPVHPTIAALISLRRDLDRNQVGANSCASDFERQLQEQEGELLQGGLFTPAEGDADSVSTQQELTASPLKASQTMRVHQQRRAAEKRIELAIAEGPESPGPLNPQMLAIKALTIMRDISPQYLNRYVSYLDTLFWVEQLDTAANNKADKKNSRVGARAKSKKKTS
jgi:hypothetical protein